MDLSANLSANRHNFQHVQRGTGLVGLPHAICEIRHHAVLTHHLDQAVYIGLKARAQKVEFPGKEQIVHNLFIEHFPRNQQRNARGIRGHQRGGDAPDQMVDGHTLRISSRNLGKRVRRFHGRGEITQVHLCGQARNVVLGVQLMDELAQVLQTHALVFGMMGTELGHDAPQGVILIVVVLELLQGR